MPNPSKHPRLAHIQQERGAKSGGVEQVVVLAHGEAQHIIEQFLLARVHHSAAAAQQERAVLHADAERTRACNYLIMSILYCL